MQTTVADIKRYIADLPDDAEVWMEHVNYGTPHGIEVHQHFLGFDEINLIPSMTCGLDNKRKRLIIFHNY